MFHPYSLMSYFPILNHDLVKEEDPLSWLRIIAPCLANLIHLVQVQVNPGFPQMFLPNYEWQAKCLIWTNDRCAVLSRCQMIFRMTGMFLHHNQDHANNIEVRHYMKMISYFVGLCCFYIFIFRFYMILHDVQANTINYSYPSILFSNLEGQHSKDGAFAGIRTELMLIAQGSHFAKYSDAQGWHY